MNDFFLDTNETYKEIYGRELYIEVVFSFPELLGDVSKARETCPAFSSVIFADLGGNLKARMRLEAIWDQTEYEDEVQSKIYWIISRQEVLFGDESSSKHTMSPYDRKHINFRYIPATRDANSTLKAEVRRLTKVLSDYSESESIKESITTISDSLNTEIQSLESVKTVSNKLEKIWTNVHDNSLQHFQKPVLESTSSEVSDILRSLIIKLSPNEGGGESNIDELSDGQISLFYFALSLAIYELEQSHYAQTAKGFKVLDKDIAVFTIFAFEEPENHLSPFYLGRVISLLSNTVQSEKAIGIITSHSSNVVRRASNANKIRHFRQVSNDFERFSVVNEIELPDQKTSDDYKFINQAVNAHPELYFSKLVILGEGDSEEIVLPQLAKKMGLDIDPSFISFVKLGGRHINHMWRLLDGLDIPYVTLLDFDLGRNKGGPPRMKNVIEWLYKKDGSPMPNLDIFNSESMENKKLMKCISSLEERNVYFSMPLDLDMSMIQAFPENYKVKRAVQSERTQLIESVLGKKGRDKSLEECGFNLTDCELTKYRYLFKSKSKVASHYIAIEEINNLPIDEVNDKCPEAIKNLIEKCADLIGSETEE